MNGKKSKSDHLVSKYILINTYIAIFPNYDWQFEEYYSLVHVLQFNVTYPIKQCCIYDTARVEEVISMQLTFVHISSLCLQLQSNSRCIKIKVPVIDTCQPVDRHEFLQVTVIIAQPYYSLTDQIYVEQVIISRFLVAPQMDLQETIPLMRTFQWNKHDLACFSFSQTSM